MAGKQVFKLEQVIEAIHEGNTPSGAASILGCHPDTIRNYARRYAKVRAAILSERKSLVDIAERGLRNALLRDEAWAVTFTLKTLGKEEGYVERTETEHTGEVTIKVQYADGIDSNPTEAAS